MSGMSASDEVLVMLRGQVVGIVLGTIFLCIGLSACAVASLRWHRGTRILAWWGIWSSIYGLQELIRTAAILAVLPRAVAGLAPYVNTTLSYLILAAALLAWHELVLGNLRQIIRLEIVAAFAIALGGMVTLALGGRDDVWVFCNRMLAMLALFVLLTVVLVGKLAARFLVMRGHGILAAGSIVFGLEALYTNLSSVLHYRTVPISSSLGFAVLLLSMGYVALEFVLSNERRLLSIETELETARQIQSSILPASVPGLDHLRIAATYHPMTAVAGDFYQFVSTDAQHVGILVADVSGHGIPAALIASMIKVAMHSVAAVAHDPGRVLRGLNRILWSEAHGQYVSAAYAWIDTGQRTVLYSAAGHPPLLCWRQASGELQRTLSNGLLFGIVPDAEYPVCTVPLGPSDRLVLYTDGVTEPENAAGEPFGDLQIERVFASHRLAPAAELSDRLLSALRDWQPPGTSQQDDMTLVVVDVL